MKLYSYKELTQQKIEELCSRQAEDDNLVVSRVENIISTVKSDSDAALLSYAEQFDKVKLSSLFIGKEELVELASQIGTAVLPSTFLMLGIPAKIAGCKEIVVCSPPQSDGKINTYIAYVSTLLNIEKVYLVGGAQAVGAMAFGTQTIPKVDKIFGPGNRYVTEAKKLVQNTVAIDMPAGPSEVLVVADETANSAFVAADLLAQAEHGTDSQAILVSTSKQLIADVISEVEKQLLDLPRKDIAKKAIENSYAVFAETLTEAMDFSNAYAPEHLILATENFEPLIHLIINAGSVFLGNLTPESAGDYASGTNHTLPTSGFARAFSGVSVDTFLKKITFQHLTAKGLQNIGNTVEVLAEAEGLQAHKNAITIRLEQGIKSKEQG
ncbi:MAG: histidinol dehydrogenase [Pedobacter sp.]|nr:MAG: histidinol dehydrogenase [Pedobacter sp.]